MNNFVEVLITFNKRHQGLLKLYIHLGWGVSVLGRKGAVSFLHYFREVQCQQVFTTEI